jgi:hypothetical protein
MKSAVLANLAMCVCPPVAAITAAIHVPAARTVVHKLTERKHPARMARPASPRRRTVRPCDPASATAIGLVTLADLPAAASQLPPADILTSDDGTAASSGFHHARSMPDVSSVKLPSRGALGAPVFGSPFGPDTPPEVSPPPTTPDSPTSAVPDIATWLAMVIGFAMAGQVIRSTRRRDGMLGGNDHA